jgi:hypothetical protein
MRLLALFHVKQTRQIAPIFGRRDTRSATRGLDIEPAEDNI